MILTDCPQIERALDEYKRAVSLYEASPACASYSLIEIEKVNLADALLAALGCPIPQNHVR